MIDTPAKTSTKTPPWRGRLALTLVVLACVAMFVGWRLWSATYHLVIVQENALYRDGCRGLREFRNAVSIAHPHTVINLVDDQEFAAPEFQQSAEYCRNHGIKYVRIPIVKGAVPTTRQVKEFLDIATDPSKQPVLYHDNEGIRRAGMMMAAYQISAMHLSREQAKASIRAFGHSDRTIDEVRQFIDAYDSSGAATAPAADAANRPAN